jgi:hypothetical protein
MVAKLVSCRTALEAGVRSVRIVDGHALDRSRGIDSAPGTLIEHAAALPRG